MYQNILFDLDGTLTDSALGITNSVKYALGKWNIKVEDRTSLYRFIGPPLQESFMRFYGFSEEEGRQAVAYYREYFADRGIFENEVYPGVEELLRQLKKQGKKLILATSKPEEYAFRILRHFGLYDYFDFAAGALMNGERSRKSEVIQYAIRNADIRNLSETVMVGDREHDIFGAREAGIDSIGVLFGYGSHEELTGAGATYIARSVSDIMSFL
ncbi:MAG: HAD family hydrolase [Lachnospiraceae bacterium]|nr:HAD family hydrolase [Lachnospiraceae bacterium]